MHKITEDIKKLKTKAINIASDLQPWQDYYRLRAKELEILFSIYRPKRVNRILEIGCGNGFISAILSRFTNEVIATDLTRLDIKTHSMGILSTKKLIQRLNIKNCKVVSCSAEELPFEDKSFELVFCAYTLEHIPDKNKALKEVRRILKNNGETIFLVPNFMERLLYPFSFYPQLFKKVIETVFRRNNRIKSKKMEPYFTFSDANQPDSLASTLYKLHRNYPHFPIPEPHGTYRNYFLELVQYLPKMWLNMFELNGFKIESIFSTMLMPKTAIGLFTDSLKLYEKLSWIDKRLGNRKMFRKIGQNICIIIRK